MAVYEKASKRVSDKTTLIKFVAGILAFVLVFIGTVFVIQQATKGLDYSDFSDNVITKVSEVLEQDEEKYLVYIYSSNSNSEAIKEDVLNFAEENEAGIKVYFVDYANFSGDDKKVEKDELAALLDKAADKLDNLMPVLLAVKDGKIVGRHVTNDDIVGTLKDVNKGGYVKFN